MKKPKIEVVLVFAVCLAVLLTVTTHFKSISMNYLLGSSFNEDHATSMPHIVMIVADDLGWNSIGYKTEKYRAVSPFLTQLAERGVIMTNFYAQEVCSPSRAALLTGRYPASLGMQMRMVATGMEWGLNISETLLPQVLQDHGYATHMLGKWHLGFFSPAYLPTARGFDSFTGFLNGESYYYSKLNTDYPTITDLLSSDPFCYWPYTDTDRHNYSSSFYATKAVDIINNHDTSNSEQPMFLYLSFQAVHSPFSELEGSEFDDGPPDSLFPQDTLRHIHHNFTVSDVV